MISLSIGSIVYVRNVNHRRYITGQAGPVESGHWVECKIVAETSRSWVLDTGTKLPKSGNWSSEYAANVRERDLQIWLRVNRHKIVDAIKSLTWGSNADKVENIRKLIAVAEILNYEPKAPV